MATATAGPPTGRELLHAVDLTELPQSRVALLLVSTEGRDKLFKVVQYVLHLAAWSLQRHTLFPEQTNAFRGAWARRLAMNAATVRNGRELFALGRFVVTAIELIDIVRRLRAMLAGRERYSARRYRIVAVLLVRAVASVVRGVLRNAAFLASKDFFGFSLGGATANAMRRVMVACALAIAGAEFVQNFLRLKRPGWWLSDEAETIACDCSQPADRRQLERLVFPAADAERGCPAPRSLLFLDAVAPGDMAVRCQLCMVESPMLPLDDDQREPSAAAADGSPGLKRADHAAGTDRVAKADAARARSERDGGVLLLPWIVHRLRTALFLVGRHHNLTHSLLLQAKAAADLYVAAVTDPLAVLASDDAAIRDDPVLPVAGLVSAFVGLSRAAMTAQ
jgi:hypothetical protein